MKTFLVGLVVGLLAMAGLWGVLALTDSRGAHAPDLESEVLSGSNTGVLELICELSLEIEGQVALGIKTEEPSRMTLAQIDFERKSGWYQGRIAISESRSGTLSVAGNKLKVVRPAMFERFGVMINREEFVVDRKTGSFTQTIGTQDGRIIPLIKGTCAQVIKAPF